MAEDRTACRIEGYAIVSEDGMLATADGVMPDALKFDADQEFFASGLDAVDVVVHGRHSHEQQPRSHLRRRVVLTRRIADVTAHPRIDNAVLWNPGGASFESALAAVGAPPRASVGVVGGTDVFGLFLDRYDVFHLSRAPKVKLPHGRPVFPGVPRLTPEQLLAEHGLEPGEKQFLDPAKGVSLVTWHRRMSQDTRPSESRA